MGSSWGEVRTVRLRAGAAALALPSPAPQGPLTPRARWEPPVPASGAFPPAGAAAVAGQRSAPGNTCRPRLACPPSCRRGRRRGPGPSPYQRRGHGRSGPCEPRAPGAAGRAPDSSAAPRAPLPIRPCAAAGRGRTARPVRPPLLKPERPGPARRGWSVLASLAGWGN